MASNAVNLGAGAVTGMFYHAPKGTALPTHPTDTLAEAWKEVGYVSEDGITWHHGRSAESLKDWSNTIRRQHQSQDDKTVTVPIISTTKEVLETIFGAGNVVSAVATAAHGNLVSVEVKEGTLSGEEAFLFLMKDGDDAFMLGTTSGFITTLDDISFAPGAAITWNATVSGNSWVFMKDDGQVVVSP